MKTRRWLASAFALVLAMFGIGTAASATPGTVVNSGSIQVQMVWMHEYVAFAPSTRNLDVDCPSGTEVLTGYGTWAFGQTGGVSDVPGSALDADTWRVPFVNSGSQTIQSYLLAHAACI